MKRQLGSAYAPIIRKSIFPPTTRKQNQILKPKYQGYRRLILTPMPLHIRNMFYMALYKSTSKRRDKTYVAGQKRKFPPTTRNRNQILVLAEQIKRRPTPIPFRIQIHVCCGKYLPHSTKRRLGWRTHESEEAVPTATTY